MKYLAGRPEFVKWVGWAHGILFVGYAGLVFWTWLKHRWPLHRPALLGIAALVPLGPFLIEKHLLKWESEK
jgi:integral membrane protein